jgi:uncharacterized damage-inducible protein DinB
VYRAGAIGAMMDELERATRELITILQPLSKEGFERIRDPQTRDENCRSIQTIVSHVVSAGYGYANYLRQAFSIEVQPYQKRQLRADEISARANEMLQYTVETLQERWTMSDDDMQQLIINSHWGTRYDIEQMLEHAIVHVLRHRRQIQRWLE